MTLFSIIIPIFNGATWLHHSLDSLLFQSEQNWEAICVDDGSSDNTLEILHQWADRDSRIKVFSQKNQGVSAARNTAIEHAQGCYLLFLDADDWLLPHSLTLLLEHKQRNPHAHLIFALQHYYEDGQRENIKLSPMRFVEINYPYEFVANIEDIFRLRPNAVNHLYSREIVMKHGIRFPLGVPHGEDTQFVLDYMSHEKSFIAFDEPLYQYYQRADSACHHPELFQKPVEYFMKTIRCYIHLIKKLTHLPFARREIWRIALFQRAMRESYDIISWMHGEGAYNEELIAAMAEMRRQLKQTMPLMTRFLMKVEPLQKLLG